MKAGDVGEEDRECGQRSSEEDKIQGSLCDVSSEEVEKTLPTVKELHQCREVRRLQGKVTGLRKERLSVESRTGSIPRTKELTEQGRALNDTIHDLQGQLNTKECDRCTGNKTYRNMLQQEFYDIQQQNLKFTGELTAETNKLRGDNRQLLARPKMKQQQFRRSFSSSDDDFVLGSQKSESVILIRDPPPGPERYVAVKLITQTNTKQMKSRGKKKRPHSPESQVPFYSQDIFEVPESPQEISSNSRKTITISSGSQKSSSTVPSASTLGPQMLYAFQDDSRLPDARLGHPQSKNIFTQRTSPQKISTPNRGTEIDFPWSLSSISPGEELPAEILSETSAETMIDYSKSIFSPFTRKDENITLESENDFLWSLSSISPGEELLAEILSETPAETMIDYSKSIFSPFTRKDENIMLESEIDFPWNLSSISPGEELPAEILPETSAETMVDYSKSIFSLFTRKDENITLESEIDFPWSLSSISPVEELPAEILPETSAETMIDYSKSIFSPFTRKDENITLESEIDFPWSLSSISPGEELPAEILSETPAETMIDYSKSIFSPFTRKDENITLENEIDFPWSLSSISPGEELPAEILSETSAETMIDYSKSIFSPFTRKDENTTEESVIDYSKSIFSPCTRRDENNTLEGEIDFPWSLSSISPGEELPAEILPETSAETMTDYRKSVFSPCTRKDKNTTEESVIDYNKSIFSPCIRRDGNTTEESVIAYSKIIFSPCTQRDKNTTEESVIDYSRSIFSPCTRRDDNTIIHLFPLDSTSSSKVKSPSFGVFRVAMREISSQTPCSKQSTARKNTNGAAGAALDADKSQGETQACTSGSSIKRKVKIRLEKGGK